MTDPERAFGRDRLALLAEIEPWHFWFAGRRVLVSGWLQAALPAGGGRVLDVGCGTGAMARHLSGLGYAVIGIDPHAGALNGTVPAAHFLGGDARELPIASSSVQAVLMLDVLEHTDDSRALREAHRVLRPDGLLIVTVPALPSLWSQRDQLAGHLRRYTRQTLRDVVTRAGFTIERWTAYQCLLLPAVAWSRWRSRNRSDALSAEDRPGPVANRLFGLVNGIELSLGRLVRWPIGSTLVVQARKPRAISDTSSRPAR